MGRPNTAEAFDWEAEISKRERTKDFGPDLAKLE
jgi:hypothetical protein